MMIARIIVVLTGAVVMGSIFYRTFREEEVKDNIIEMNAMAIYAKGTPREMVWRQKIVEYVKKNIKYVDMDDIVWREDLQEAGLL